MRRWYVTEQNVKVNFGTIFNGSGVAQDDVYEIRLDDGQKTPTKRIFARKGYRLLFESIAAATTAQAAEAVPVDPQAEVATPGSMADRLAALEARNTVVQASVVDLLAEAEWPMYVAHRGGPRRFAENSLEAFEEALRGGFMLETDVEAIAGGHPVIAHDGTADRTTDGTGDWSTFTLAQYRALTLDPRVPGQRRKKALTWREWLDLSGGKVLINPEVKDGAARARVIADLTRRGLHRAAVVLSFSRADVQAFVAAGLPAVHVGSNITAVPVAQAVADGLYGVSIAWSGAGSLSTAEGLAYITAAKAAGLKVFSWTINSRTQADAAIAAGVDGIVTDDPWWVSRQAGRQDRDDYGSKRLWPGYVESAPGHGFLGGSEWGLPSLANNVSRFSLHSQYGFRGPRLRATFEYRLLAQSGTMDATRWGGIFIGRQPEGLIFNDGAQADQFGYHWIFRRSGITGTFVNDGTATTSVGATVAPATPRAPADGSPGEWARVQVEITDTHLNFTDFTRGESSSIANASVRPSDARVTFTANGSGFAVRNVLLEDL